MGRLVAGHGVRGLARVKPFNPTSPTLTACEDVWLAHEPSGRRARFRIRENRRHKGHFLLGFDGIDSLNDLLPWIGSTVEADAASVPAPDAGEIYHYEAVGLEVRTVSGEVLGTVVEVMPLPAQDVWVVRGPAEGGRSREVLLPVAENVVREVDLTARTALVDPPPGLVEP
ncbi:MAG: ribosome maturation factor RimM [Thermodesulfobacteriota bacterium]